MLSPDFSDEETRREVCHMGVVVADDGSVDLEEKGTVYNEMVSSYERPWGHLYDTLTRRIYGKSHPLALSSGGLPAAIRSMTPEDIREFHASTHHLSNMGAVVALGGDVALAACLGQIGAILARVEPGAAKTEDPAGLWDRLPPPAPGEPGSIDIVSFPNKNAAEPGIIALAWPPAFDLSSAEDTLLELFLDLLAAGETSSLYGKLVDSQTRVMDIGATSVYWWRSREPGRPIYVGVENVRADLCDRATVEQVVQLVLDEIRNVAEWQPESAELRAFNERARNRLMAERRQLRDFVGSPPRWGFRGTGARWIEYLQALERRGGFRRDLASTAEFDFAADVLSSGGNQWASYLAGWNLLELQPFGAATRPDPSMIEAGESARRQRVEAYVEDLQARYDVPDPESAIRRYQEEYGEATNALAALAATVPMPNFTANPPLTLDDALQYEEVALPGGAPVVATTFDNITRLTCGLALNLDVVPEEQLFLVPALPVMLTEIGVVREGVAVPYDDFKEALSREILELEAYLSSDNRSGRAELVLRAAGSDSAESRQALGWLRTALESPDLSVANLPRVRDAVDIALSNARNRRRGSEESWVQNPANAYRSQVKPLLLEASSFLTQVHSLHRLRWRLKEVGDGVAFERFLRGVLAEVGAAADESGAVAEKLEAMRAAFAKDAPGGEGLGDLAIEALEDLSAALAELPDEGLKDDLLYLGAQMQADGAVAPADALAELETVLDLVRRQDNARVFVISNAADRILLWPDLEAIVESLGRDPSVRQRYSAARHIDQRWSVREGRGEVPRHVGLVNASTRAGVHIHTAPCASYTDSDEDGLLRFVAARLYGGGGAHSMFMKTWAEGLAYSNGLRSGADQGRLLYYAERCPDLMQTMQFVVDQLANAPLDTTLSEYAIAQVFSANRAGARYEERGESMAEDLADGVTPDRVKGFREGVLALRRRPGLHRELYDLMPEVYGQVLPGYGAAGGEGTVSFVIGPHAQLDSWEAYLDSCELGGGLGRLYPRDFWRVVEVDESVFAGD